MRLAVLGLGLIGGSIGLAARRHVGDAEVVGYDPDPDAASAALERGAVHAVAGSAREALERADACFACAPVTIPRFAPMLDSRNFAYCSGSLAK